MAKTGRDGGGLEIKEAITLEVNTIMVAYCEANS